MQYAIIISRVGVFTQSGSRHDRPPFEFIAGKRSVKFRFPEADIHHRVLTTQTVQKRPPVI